MAVDITSRYRGTDAIVAPDAHGDMQASLPARLPGRATSTSTPYFHTVIAGETMESLADRYLGSSRSWWHLADANPSVFPLELQPGATLVIPTQVDVGLVVRTRTF